MDFVLFYTSDGHGYLSNFTQNSVSGGRKDKIAEA